GKRCLVFHKIWAMHPPLAHATLHGATRSYPAAMREVTVPLGARKYSILVGTKLLSELGGRCAELKLGRRCAIITDRNVAEHYASAAEKSLRVKGFDPVRIVVPAGETA